LRISEERQTCGPERNDPSEVQDRIKNHVNSVEKFSKIFSSYNRKQGKNVVPKQTDEIAQEQYE